MSSHLSPPDPARFGLVSFADMLPGRDPIIGEAPGSFARFHEGMMRALTPFTPYECVIAENLIAIEWELLQRRHMRDASLRAIIREEVGQAVMARERALHEERLDAAWHEHVQQGGDAEDWTPSFRFDTDAAEALANELAARSVSPDPDIQAAVHAEIVDMGLDPVALMSAAYLKSYSPALRHDVGIKELECRRREVKRDYDALQKARPLEGEIIDR